MSKSTGASNYCAIFAMSDATTITGTDDGDAIYVFDNVETSSYSTQASGLKDITIVDQEFNAALRTLFDTVLPNDPTAGSEATEDEELEDGSGGGSASSVIPSVFVIYMGPVDATDGTREVVMEIAKFDRSSEDLASTKSGTTNKATIKLIGQKPTGSTTIAKELLAAAKVTVPVANPTALSTSNLLNVTWIDVAV